MQEKSASEQIDDIITMHASWKGELLSRLRAIITSADPHIVEEVKWKMRTRPEGLAVWSHNGIVCRVEIFNDDLKLVFSKGAQMQDQQKLFNARLNSSAERAIEFHDGDTINEAELRALVIEAVQLNNS